MPKTRRKYKGNATNTTIPAGLSTGATSVTIAGNTGWPTSGPFYCVVDPGSSSEEKILVGSISGTTISSITRGVDDTTDQNHAAGCTIYPVFTAVDADEANELTSTYSAQGHIVYQGATTFTGLAIGTAGQVLKVNSGATAPEWGQVATAGIADDAVTSAKIAADAVGSSEIASGAVGTAELADDSVTAAKIANAAVTEAKLSDTLPLGVINEIKTVTSNWTTSGAEITGTKMASYTYKTGRVYRFSWVAQGTVNAGSTVPGRINVGLWDGTTVLNRIDITVPLGTLSNMPVSSSYVFVPSSDTTKQFGLFVLLADAFIRADSSTPIQFWVEDLGKL